jgi:hypothetical protein
LVGSVSFLGFSCLCFSIYRMLDLMFCLSSPICCDLLGFEVVVIS